MHWFENVSAMPIKLNIISKGCQNDTIYNKIYYYHPKKDKQKQLETF